MIYIDTSCLVKSLRREESTTAVINAIRREVCVVISNLVELEALVELKGGFASGRYSLAQLRRSEFELHNLRNAKPFKFLNLPASVLEIAIRQHRNATETNCRTLDRIHLAAAEKLGIRRLMTHDNVQADAAKELGMEAIMPGR